MKNHHDKEFTTIRFTSIRSAENFKAKSGSNFPILKNKNSYSVKIRISDHKTKPPRKNPQLNQKNNNLNQAS